MSDTGDAMKRKFFSLLLLLALLTGCGAEITSAVETTANTPTDTAVANTPTQTPDAPTDLGDEDESFGDAIKDTGAYDGYFENASGEITVTCLAGTENAYTLTDSTLTFTAIGEDTTYALSGEFSGNIVIDVGDAYKFELELNGFSLISDETSPITALSGDKISIKAKKDTVNYLYDTREAVDDDNTDANAAAICAAVDLELCGKGSLTVVSENNKGVRTKDDLTVKNLTLFVSCTDNALKGNDGVSLIGGTTTLIATEGDGIKTENSGLSASGKQQGNITVAGGTHTIYAACDGIDAAHDVTVSDASTVLTVYTDKYSNYSDEVTANTDDVYYIRYTKNTYSYSVKYYNSDDDYLIVNATYHSKVSGGFSSGYYYYTFPKKTEYAKMQLFAYTSDMEQGQEEDYALCSDYMTPNTANDTIALTSRSGRISLSWTNYTTTSGGGGFGGGGFGGGGGMGGGGDGNSDKGDHSTKGIKAANTLTVSGGTLAIKSYDDALHAGGSETLENGSAPTGDLTISGGVITLYSNDDGLHADGRLTVTGGAVTVSNAYEGVEGKTVTISGGSASITAKDDGINATTQSGTAVEISGGEIYINCTGDGIDSNSRTQGVGIVFSGGNTVVISNSSMNSSIDTENGYTYSGGYIVAIMPRGGMSNEATHSDQFNTYGKSTQLSLPSGQFLVCTLGDVTATVRIPTTISSAIVVTYGDKTASVKTAASTSASLNADGVAFE